MKSAKEGKFGDENERKGARGEGGRGPWRIVG